MNTQDDVVFHSFSLPMQSKNKSTDILIGIAVVYSNYCTIRLSAPTC